MNGHIHLWGRVKIKQLFFIDSSSEQVVDDLPTAIAATSISITDNQFHSRL